MSQLLPNDGLTDLQQTVVKWVATLAGHTAVMVVGLTVNWLVAVVLWGPIMLSYLALSYLLIWSYCHGKGLLDDSRP